MAAKKLVFLRASLIAGLLHASSRDAVTQPMEQRLVRIAELEIDPSQLESYKLALKEEIETSIRLEPGVLTLYAVSLKDHPAQIRIFETYADEAAYQAHLKTDHFKKYKRETERMVKTLNLVETDPIALGSSRH
jgi:quinol monooxygenase YgiN